LNVWVRKWDDTLHAWYFTNYAEFRYVYFTEP
jgi:hypothetical protein